MAECPPDLRAQEGRPASKYYAGGPEWRTASRLIHSRLRGSLEDTEEYVAKVFKEAGRTYNLRPAAYIPWVSSQLATLYPESPKVKYKKADGTYLDGDLLAYVGQLRKESGIDQAFQAAHDEAVTTGNGVVWVTPARRGKEGQQRLVVEANNIPAHAQAVDLGGRPISSKEEDVATWWARMPIPGSYDPAYGCPLNGIAKVTATEAVWEVANASNVKSGDPIWDGGKHIGQVPAIVIRWAPPAELGHFWSMARFDLLEQARALDLGFTDLGEISLLQGYGQWVGEGMEAGGASKLRMGPRTIAALPSGQKLSVLNANPNLQGYIGQLEGYMRVAVSSQTLNPAGLLRSTAVTALAKEIELSDRDDIRQKHIGQFAIAEQRFYDLLRAWHRAFHDGQDVLPEVTVEVEYATPRSPADPLHELQAAMFRVALGFSSIVRERAQMFRVPYTQAETDIKDDLAVTKRILGYIPQPPGVGAPGGGAAPREAIQATGVTSSTTDAVDATTTDQAA